LWATQRVFFGPIKHSENAHLSDLSFREGLVLAPLVIMAVVMGVYPQPFLNTVNPSVAHFAQQFRARAGLPPLVMRPGAAHVQIGVPALPGANNHVPPSPQVGDLQRQLQWYRSATTTPGLGGQR
jgi:NADH-quinone oxidoreductase subunit M